MFAKYVSLPTSTQAQVQNDLALLLSGAAISALSASCDKTNTTLLSTVAPGWTLADTAGPNTGYAVTAPDAAGTTTKVGLIYTSSAALIGVLGYETYNASTHVGTNVTAGVTFAYSSTTINTYFIFATPRSFYITPSNGQGAGIFEFSRDCQYLIGTNYPCFAVVGNAALAAFSSGATTTQANATAVLNAVPRTKNLVAAGDLTGATSGVYLATITSKIVTAQGNSQNSGWFWSIPSYAPNTKLLDANGIPYYEVRPLWAISSGYPNVGATIGKFYDILETSIAVGNTMDTISDGTNTYAIVNISQTGYNLAATYAFKMA